MMRSSFALTLLVAVFAGSAFAEWKPGDPHKMHFPQLPDPNGLDVDFEVPHVLADDWECAETGPVSDIHFWVSHKEAPDIPAIWDLQVEIYSNIPETGGRFSMPGQRLWDGSLSGDDFDFATAAGGTGDQGWYDPTSGLYIPNDHTSYFQINLTNLTDPFTQVQGEIYWLAISIDTSEDHADGWKTADLNAYPAPFTGQHYKDDAVYQSDLGGWAELRYPSAHPLAGQSIDLAFVITPEPATLCLLALGGLALVRRRR
jgi:hypothetical protein